MALLTHRSTPFPWCKLSPSELLMGRRTCSNIPMVKHSLKPDWKYLEDFQANNEKLTITDTVQNRSLLSQSTQKFVTVVANADSPRSYIVETPNGLVRRNREHLNVMSGSREPPEQTQPQTQPRSPIMTHKRTGTPIVAPDRLQIQK